MVIGSDTLNGCARATGTCEIHSSTVGMNWANSFIPHGRKTYHMWAPMWRVWP